MAEIIQATLQAGAEIITANLTSGSEEMTATVYVAATGPTGPPGPQGPEGPPGTGSTSFAALTDKTTADIPTINTPLATALALKAPLASPTFTGVVTAPRIKGKCDGLELECKAGQSITAGQVVYVTGASGTNVIVGLARADSEVTSSKTIGVSESTLALNGIGYVITEGLMDVDLTVASTVTVGDPIWLSGATAGGMLFGIANKPSYPYHQVYLGVVTRKTGTTKVTEIYVKVQNGFEISELSDVSIVDPMEGQALMRNATKWTNRTLVSADISDATDGPSASTLALRDTLGDLHAVDLYCDGVPTGTVEDGKLCLYDSTVGDYSSIKSNAGSFYLYPPPISLRGTVVINPNSSTVNSNLTFQNTSLETYTFPVSGGTLLANTGNLVGLTNLPTARTSLGLGTGNSPTFAGVNIDTDVILTRKTTRTLRLGAADANPPLTQTLAVQSATGPANVAGATFTIAGSQGTGSGAGGSIIFQTAPAGTAGQTTTNPLATALTIASTGNVGIGTTTPEAPIHIRMTHQDSVREILFKAQLDESNSQFFIYNGTSLNASFAPNFGGYTEDTLRFPLGFTGFVPSLADASDSSTFGLIDFAAFRTTDSSSPANGTLTDIANRKIMTVRSLTNTYFTIAASGNVGIGTITPTEKLSVAGNISATENLIAKIRLQGTAPASATATGTAGDIRYDASYVYICTATNTWKRSALTTWP